MKAEKESTNALDLPLLVHYHIHELHDHDPSHLHARCEDQEVRIKIKSGIVKGEMSERALRMLFEWS
jgi:hypothetical protein